MEIWKGNKDKHLLWLNCAKTAAIFAVVTDHTNGLLYSNPKVAEASYFSVSLFIIISGITSYISNRNSDLNWGKAYIRSTKKIFIEYLIASAIWVIVKNKEFNPLFYVRCLVHFNATLPLYYVCLYLQLMLVGKLLVDVLKRCPRNKKGYLMEMVLFVGIVGISVLTTNYTQILDIYGGGGKVLGGTYLILFYIGMLIAKHEWLAKDSLPKSVIIWLIASLGWFFCWQNLENLKKIFDYKVPLGGGFNPPSITFMLFALFALFAVYGFCKILEKTKYTRIFVEVGARIGKHTLHIFMYHTMIIYYFLVPCFPIENMWLKRVFYWGVVVVASILLEFIIGKCLNVLKRFIGKMIRGERTDEAT